MVAPKFDTAGLESSIMKGYESYIEQGNASARTKRRNVYASSYEQCDRKMVLLMTEGDKIPPFPVEVLAKFHRGRERERSLIIDLSRVGEFATPTFAVMGQQERFELRDHKGRVAITGKVDLRLDYGHGKPCPPCEIKDWHPSLTDKIESFGDLFGNPWTKKGAYQLLSYLFGANEPFGFLILARPGLPRLIPVSLYDYLNHVEEFLTKAERALDHKEAGTLPDHIQDVGECKRCDFYGVVCDPPLLSGEGAQIIIDPEVEQALTRREELKEAALEYARIDVAVKKRFRDVESAIAGKFLLEGSYGKKTIYDYPDEIAAKYRRVDPKGRFNLKITKV